MKVVKYISNHNGYGAGERAGWSDDYADALVKDGVAEHVKPVAAKDGPPNPPSVGGRKIKPARVSVRK